MANADNSEMAILPTAMINALARLTHIMGKHGANGGASLVLPPKSAKLVGFQRSCCPAAARWGWLLAGSARRSASIRQRQIHREEHDHCTTEDEDQRAR
jgi:hypothetical protein